MILYHPYNDFYHCIYRLILLLYRLPVGEYEIQKIQILDFYLVFPNLLKSIKLPRNFISYKTYIKEIKEPYSTIIEPKKIIKHMGFQIENALKYLASYELIDINKLKSNIISKINTDNYLDFINKTHSYDDKLLDIIINVLSNIPLNGVNGLKDRTKLFEYRYDYV